MFISYCSVYCNYFRISLQGTWGVPCTSGTQPSFPYWADLALNDPPRLQRARDVRMEKLLPCENISDWYRIHMLFIDLRWMYCIHEDDESFEWEVKMVPFVIYQILIFIWFSISLSLSYPQLFILCLQWTYLFLFLLAIKCCFISLYYRKWSYGSVCNLHIKVNSFVHSIVNSVCTPWTISSLGKT